MQLAFRTTKHRQSSHLDHASKTSVLNTCRKTFFGLMIIRHSGKEELGRKLRRRQAGKMKRKLNTQNCQLGDNRSNMKGTENAPSTFTEFHFNLPGSSRHPVVLVSSSQWSSPQICASILPFELALIQHRSASVLWLQMT